MSEPSLTLLLLRNGSLPLPLAGEGLNVIDASAFAGMTEEKQFI